MMALINRMEQSLNMSLHKKEFISGLKLSVSALAVFAAGSLFSPASMDAEASTLQSIAAPGLSLAAYAAGTETGGTQVVLAENHPDEYIVKKGDTLWDISGMFLKDPWYWPEIWQINPQIENPHLIYPGDVLALVYIDGQPRLINRGSATRLSPQARVTKLEAAIDVIPHQQIAAFLSKGLVIAGSEIDELPYMLASRGDHMIAAAGNDIYVRGATGAPGSHYSVVHIGDKLVDPDDGKVVGYQGIYVGNGVVKRDGDPTTFSLTDTNREALQGDRLVPEAVSLPQSFYPKAPDSMVDGQIISVVDGVSLIGQYQVVVLNRGDRNGLSAGDVLTVFRAGEVVKDRHAGRKVKKIKLPDEIAGTIMVFKVYDRISYALVMEATSDIHVLDAVRNPS